MGEVAKKLTRPKKDIKPLTLYRAVLNSAAWRAPNLRWSQPSPLKDTMTKAAFAAMGDRVGMTAPRQLEIQGRNFTFNWLTSCPQTCSNCYHKSDSGFQDCRIQNLHRNYPLPWNAMQLLGARGRNSAAPSSPAVTGVAILGMDDSGRASCRRINGSTRLPKRRFQRRRFGTQTQLSAPSSNAECADPRRAYRLPTAITLFSTQKRRATFAASRR